MLKQRKKHGAFLCLPAAFLTLLTPLLFSIHAGRCGTSSPLCGAGALEYACGDCSTAYTHSHSGAHDPNNCPTCQALLHYASGVTIGSVRETPVPADFTLRASAPAARMPGEPRLFPFFSRAPPPPADVVCS